MSSSAVVPTSTRPYKRARLEVSRPNPKFEKGDFAVVRRDGAGHAKLGTLVVDITEVKYNEQHGAWQYEGKITGTKMMLTAAEADLLKPEFRPGQKVSFSYNGRAILCGKIESIEVDTLGDISYGITADTLKIPERQVSKVYK